ncbi:ShlB/FhaC/HecB family hemolysin secretion/activation protein [Pseudoduganella violaceinigra]|uniref:ShlB/FhaC/HecB family hemolysin secretion/activation protein n=1 Tax=Pseudoduganella violaceinigra TaxID=246602 RepID=UPI00047F2018|nr:ShlB/FhaC/HecB family hemolysin secretion/activation protein [Pseudoduganella violaceinigra]
MNKKNLALAILGAPAFALAQAQTLPDAGRILEQNRLPALVLQPAASAKVVPDAAPVPGVALEGAQKVMVRRFVLQGVSAFAPAQVEQVLTPYTGRELTFAELQQACNAVTNYYRSAGYFVASAMLPAQDVGNGEVTIQVLEGRISRIGMVPDAKVRLQADVARRYVDALVPAGQPVQEDRLERALLLTQDLPGMGARAELSKGQGLGESELAVQLNEGPLASGSVSLDNSSNRFTGATRLSGSVALNDLGGMGGQLSLLGATSGDGFRYGRAAYIAPVGSGGLKAGASFSRLRYKLGEEFETLHAHGAANVGQLIASYPLLRTRSTNIQLRTGFDDKRYENFANGAQTSDKHVKVLPLALTFSRQQEDASTQASLELSLGHLALDGNPASASADAAGARTEGRFAHLGYMLGRFQRLGGNFGLLLNASGQFASRNLESGEKFSLGGPGRVRAYPAGEASGDEGHVLTSELHYELASVRTDLAAFVDVGHVRLNNGLYAGALAANGPGNSYTLKGAGLGATWRSVNGAALQVQVARKLGSNPAPGTKGEDADGKSSTVRAWFNATVPF